MPNGGCWQKKRCGLGWIKPAGPSGTNAAENTLRRRPARVRWQQPVGRKRGPGRRWAGSQSQWARTCMSWGGCGSSRPVRTRGPWITVLAIQEHGLAGWLTRVMKEQTLGSFYRPLPVCASACALAWQQLFNLHPPASHWLARFVFLQLAANDASRSRIRSFRDLASQFTPLTSAPVRLPSLCSTRSQESIATITPLPQHLRHTRIHRCDSAGGLVLDLQTARPTLTTEPTQLGRDRKRTRISRIES